MGGAAPPLGALGERSVDSDSNTPDNAARPFSSSGAANSTRPSSVASDLVGPSLYLHQQTEQANTLINCPH